MTAATLITLCLMATLRAWESTASPVNNSTNLEMSSVTIRRTLKNGKDDSPFDFWDGVAEDDHDPVIERILRADIDFFHQLTNEDIHVVANILQDKRVIDTLVQGQNQHFIREVLDWLIRQGYKDLTRICDRAIIKLNLAALEPCREYVPQIVRDAEALLMHLISRGDWPIMNFFLECGLRLSTDAYVSLLTKFIISPEGEDAGSELVCNMLQQTDNDIKLGYITPLAVAAGAGKTELVRCLISKGHDPHSKCGGDNLPLDVALVSGNSDIVWILLEAMMAHEPTAALEDSNTLLEILRASIHTKDTIALENLILSQGHEILPGFLQDAYRMAGMAIMMGRPLLLEYFRPLLEASHSPLREHVDSLLDFAISAGDINLAESLLKQSNSRLATEVEVPVDAVFTAIAKGNLDMLRFLLKYTAERRPDVSSYKQALSFCVSGGNLRALRIFHELGYNLMNLPADDSLLHVAAKANNVEILRFLLQLPGVNVNSQNAEGHTPLISGALPVPPAEEAMLLLLESGADPAIADHRRRTPLSLSAGHIGETTVKALLDQGAPLLPSLQGLLTPHLDLFPLARAMVGSEGVLRLLLEAGAGQELLRSGNARSLVSSALHCHGDNICAGDNMIRTLFDDLHRLLSSKELSDLFIGDTITSQRTSLLRYFLERGVDQNVMIHNVSAVGFAAMRGLCASMDLLLEFGAHIGKDDHSGSTPLSSALTARKTRAALRLLLKHGAELDERSLQILKGLPRLFDFVKTELGRMRAKSALKRLR